MEKKKYNSFYEAFNCPDRIRNTKLSLMQLGSLAIKKTTIMQEEEIKKLSLLDYILYIDSLGTKEFCDWQGIEHPYWTGDVNSAADMFLQVDVVKLRLIKEKAKSESKFKRENECVFLKVGDKVCYEPEHYKEKNFYQNGIVKEIPEHTNESVRVVYNCNEDCENFQNYTSALTNLRDLKLGWKK